MAKILKLRRPELLEILKSALAIKGWRKHDTELSLTYYLPTDDSEVRLALAADILQNNVTDVILITPSIDDFQKTFKALVIVLSCLTNVDRAEIEQICDQLRAHCKNSADIHFVDSLSIGDVFCSVNKLAGKGLIVCVSAAETSAAREMLGSNYGSGSKAP